MHRYRSRQFYHLCVFLLLAQGSIGTSKIFPALLLGSAISLRSPNVFLVEKSVLRLWVVGGLMAIEITHGYCAQTFAVGRSSINIYIFICLYTLKIMNLHWCLQFSQYHAFILTLPPSHICTSSLKMKSWFLLLYSYWFALSFVRSQLTTSAELWCCSGVPSCEGPGSYWAASLLCVHFLLVWGPCCHFHNLQKASVAGVAWIRMEVTGGEAWELSS